MSVFYQVNYVLDTDKIWCLCRENISALGLYGCTISKITLLVCLPVESETSLSKQSHSLKNLDGIVPSKMIIFMGACGLNEACSS